MENSANNRNSVLNNRGSFTGVRTQFKPIPIRNLVNLDSSDEESDEPVPSDSEPEDQLNKSFENVIFAAESFQDEKDKQISETMLHQVELNVKVQSEDSKKVVTAPKTTSSNEDVQISKHAIFKDKIKLGSSLERSDVMYHVDCGVPGKATSTRENHKVTETPLKQMQTASGRPVPCLSQRNIFQTPHQNFDSEIAVNNAVQTPATIFSHCTKNIFGHTPMQNSTSLGKDSVHTPVQSVGQIQGNSYEMSRYYNSANKGVRRPLAESVLQQQLPKENLYTNEMKHVVPHNTMPKVLESQNELQPKEYHVHNEKIAETINEDKFRRSIFPVKQETKENENILNLPLDRQQNVVKKEVEDIKPPLPKSLYNSNQNSNNKIFISQSNFPQSNNPTLENKNVRHSEPAKPLNTRCSIPASVPISQRSKIITVKNIQYQILGTVGKGMCGEVFRVQDLSSQELHAIKCVNLSRMDRESAQGCLDEIKMINQLQAPCIVHMYDFEIKAPWVYVIMELGDTDLSCLLKSIMMEKKFLPISMVIYYWMEMLTAVKHIHDNGVIHTDLKPANFILAKGRLKLIDFGIASSINAEMTSVIRDIRVGTMNYMSPEALTDTNRNGNSPNKYGQSEKYKVGKSADVWSLGCILYSLVYGYTPFQHIKNSYAKIMAITDPKSSVSFPPPPNAEPIPPVLIDVMRKCLQYNPKARPTVDDLLRVDYFGINKCTNTAAINIPPTMLIKVKNALTDDEWRYLTEILDKARQ